MKTFYKLLVNNMAAAITNNVVWFALTYFVFLETKSVFATGMVAGIYLVAVVLCGFWFGALIDRHKKKTMMLISSLVSFVIYCAGLALFYVVDESVFTTVSSPTLWVFVTLLLAGVIAGNIRQIAMPTLVTVLVPEESRDKVNGLVGTAFGVAFLIVSMISGVLLGQGGMTAVLLVSITISIAAIIHLLTIQVPERIVAHSEVPHVPMDIKGTIAIISSISGLFALIFFTTFNNFLGGVFMALMDAYGLSQLSVEAWGFLWGFLSLGFIVGGSIIAKFGLGKNPLKALFIANIIIWSVCSVFTVYSSIIILAIGMFIYLSVFPYIEASEQTIIQKVVPAERQGRVFGFAQSLEMCASPLTAFLIGPIAQFIFIPFMTTGAGAALIGDWFGTGMDRGIALVFTITGIIGLTVTIIMFRSKYYTLLTNKYLEIKAADSPAS